MSQSDIIQGAGGDALKGADGEHERKIKQIGKRRSVPRKDPYEFRRTSSISTLSRLSQSNSTYSANVQGGNNTEGELERIETIFSYLSNRRLTGPAGADLEWRKTRPVQLLIYSRLLLDFFFRANPRKAFYPQEIHNCTCLPCPARHARCPTSCD